MSNSTTNNVRRADAERDPVHIAAAEWFVRLQERDLPLEDSLEWQRWLNTDARHAEAFTRIAQVWDQSWESLGSTPRAARRRMPPLAIAASIAGVAAVCAWFVVKGDRLTIHSDSIQTVRTAIGENRPVHLSDGSLITVGGGTALKVMFDAETRRIELLEGEAVFTVAKEPARPFTVDAGDATVTAIGTEFNVRRGRDRTVVAVVEGRVMVTPSALPAPMTWLRKTPEQRTPLQLGAGQQTTIGDDGVKSTIHLRDPAMAASWQSGQLAFREEPLRYVLEDVNRYAPKRIVIDGAPGNEPIGDIRITGTVLGNSVDGWIASLESAFGLKAREESNRIVLSRQMPQER